MTEKTNKDFLGKYVRYATSRTDAPQKYHTLVGLSLLSAVVNRNLRMKFAQKTVYTNIYAICLGASSTTRRSTSLKIGSALLPPEVKRMPEYFSAEQFIVRLSETPRAILIRDELGGFLSDLYNKKYMGGLEQSLCDLYECPERIERDIRAGNWVLENVYPNILSATTIRMFSKNTSIDTIESGFGARFLYTIADKREGWKKYRYEEEQDIVALEELKNMLQAIWKKIGCRENPIDLKFDSQALKHYNWWVKRKEDELEAMEDEEWQIMGSFYVRVGDYAAKIAMLLWAQDSVNSEISNSENSFLINKKTLLRAIKLAEEFLREAKIVVHLITESTNERILRKLLNQLKKHGELDYSTWLRNSNMKARIFQEYVQTLSERGDAMFDKERKVYRYVDKNKAEEDNKSEVKKDEQQPAAGLQGA